MSEPGESCGEDSALPVESADHTRLTARRKAGYERKQARAVHEKGLLIVVTGPGKGKTTAAFGMALRAIGHGMQVGVVQFIKGRSDTGEEAFFRTQPGVRWHVMGEGFTWETQDRARDVASAEAAWALAREMLQNPEVGLVVLDELNIALKYQYLDVERVLADLRARPPMQHVVVTGRGAPPALVEAADTVTDMTPVKHAFAAGVKAMPGMEW